MAKQQRGTVSKVGTPPKQKAADPVVDGRRLDQQRRADEAAQARARREYSTKVVPGTMRTVGSQTGMPKRSGRR